MANETITQQLRLTEYPIILRDGFGNIVYEDDGLTWKKHYYDSNHLPISSEIGKNHIKS